MTELNFWQYVKNKINNGDSLILTVVFDANDSTPGRTGFKMIAGKNGDIFGSIGGGKMEFEVINEGIKNLDSADFRNYFNSYNHYGDTPGSTGMICCGSQIIGFVKIGKDDIQTVSDITESIEKNKSGLLSINKERIFFSSSDGRTKKFSFDKSAWLYEELIGIKERVYIFGGGHVGLSVSRIMSLIDFHVILIEKRKDIFTLRLNDFANEFIHEDYVEFAKNIIEDDFSYIVIVTPSHLYDKDVLRAVINKNVKYIGMMGSKAKVKTLFDELKKEGIEDKLIEPVHSPIGLQIASKTPDEIAVSIAAEIIKVKNSVLF
ncbi:MAG: XdhC family protein [Ignavibacteria bacterium]|nr:XdhC family protein [Ignavibacteria bacterium]